MKANELMIGDWILSDDRFVRVLEVKLRKGITVEDAKYTDDYWVDGEYRFGVCGFPIDHVNFIPLTEDILEKNGFRPHKFDELRETCTKGKWWHRSLNVWIKSYYLREKGMKTYGIGTRNLSRINNIVYVHELQHALRLCGQIHLADNFKID